MQSNLLKVINEITVTIQNDNGEQLNSICRILSQAAFCNAELIYSDGAVIASCKNSVLKPSKKMELPLKLKGEIIAVLAVEKEDDFLDSDRILFETASWALSVIVVSSLQREHDQRARKVSIVKSAIGTLSFSELEAVLHVFQALDGLEGRIIASKIAEKMSIARSVIVNALRKLESAEVLEARSMGMKGTHIRVLNEAFLDELNKLRR